MRVHLKTLNGEEFTVGGDILPIECFRCGYCCKGYHPQLSHEEVAHMAGHLGISPDQFISRYVQVTTIGYLLRQDEHGCVFLDWEKVYHEQGRRDGAHRACCTIHSFRPEACRNWQAGLSRRECQAGLAMMQKENGMMLVGDLYDDPEQIEKFCQALRHLR